MDYFPVVFAEVSAVCDKMTDAEIASLLIPVKLWIDPTQTLGYNKGKSLFTENNETAMHRDTRAAFLAYANKRLDAPKE